MKIHKLLVGSLAAMTLLVVGFVGIASAHSFQAGDNVSVNDSQVINQSLFVAGNSVDVSSEVFGDVFCAGQNITISGKVHGDVICAGQTINITAAVDGDVRLAGQSITLSSTVGGNASIVGQSFTLGSNAKVTGDVSIAGADSNIVGTVGRDLAASGQTVTVAGAVSRNVIGTIATLKLTGDAKVGGNIDFTSNNDISKSASATVGGTTKRTDAPKEHNSDQSSWAAFSFGWFVYSLLAGLAIALALVLLLPRALHNITNKALPTPWKALLTGFIASLAMPAIIVILAITVIGIPLGFIIGLIWLVVILLSGPVLAYYIGRLVLRDSHQPIVIMLAGASLLLVMYFIPIIGFLAMLAAIWLGSGMILLDLFYRTPQPSYVTAEAKTVPTKNDHK